MLGLWACVSKFRSMDFFYWHLDVCLCGMIGCVYICSYYVGTGTWVCVQVHECVCLEAQSWHVFLGYSPYLFRQSLSTEPGAPSSAGLASKLASRIPVSVSWVLGSQPSRRLGVQVDFGESEFRPWRMCVKQLFSWAVISLTFPGVLKNSSHTCRGW